MPKIPRVCEKVERSSKCVVEVARRTRAIGQLLLQEELLLLDPADAGFIGRDDRGDARLDDAVEQLLDLLVDLCQLRTDGVGLRAGLGQAVVPQLAEHAGGDLEQRGCRADAPAGAARPLLAALAGAKDASDFRRLLVEGYREINFVEVSDDGEGMSLRDLEEIFLTIGTRSRRKEKSAWSDRDDDPSRTLLGDKGVGRLSVMRLGEHLSVRTTKAGESRWNDLAIDWTRFSHDSDALLEEIAVAPEQGQIGRAHV